MCYLDAPGKKMKQVGVMISEVYHPDATARKASGVYLRYLPPVISIKFIPSNINAYGLYEEVNKVIIAREMLMN